LHRSLLTSLIELLLFLDGIVLTLVNNCEVEDVAVDEVYRATSAVFGDAFPFTVGAVGQYTCDQVEDNEAGAEDDEELGATLGKSL